MDQITGYVLWGVGVLFLVAVMVSIGAIVAGVLHAARLEGRRDQHRGGVLLRHRLHGAARTGRLAHGFGLYRRRWQPAFGEGDAVSSRTREVGGWGRRRLLMILAAVALMILSLIFGLIMVAHHAATQVAYRRHGRDPAMTDRQHRSTAGFSRCHRRRTHA